MSEITAKEARRIVLSALASFAPSPVPAADAGEAAIPATGGAGEEPPSLAAHDLRFHPEGYRPGDRCKLREALARGDKADLVAAEEEEEEDMLSAPSPRLNGTAKSRQLGTPPAEPPSVANTEPARRNFVVTPEILADFQSRVNGGFHVTENMIRRLDNGSPLTPDVFIPRLAERLHMSDPDARSHYRTYALPDGTVFSLRLSDHSAHPESYNTTGTAGDFNISLVVQPAGGDALLRGATPNVVITQYTYDKESLDRADLRLILESLRDLFATGEYIDRTGKARVDSQNIPATALDAAFFAAFDAAPAAVGSGATSGLLAQHDRRFHPNGFDPAKDRCKLREELAKGDDADLVAAESAEEAAAPANSMSVPAKMPPLPKRKPATPAIIAGADADSLLDMDRNATGRKYGPYKVGNIAIASDGRAIAAVRSDGDGLPDCDTKALLDYLPDHGETAKLVGRLGTASTTPVCTVGIENLRRAVSNAHWNPELLGYLFADLSNPSAPAIRVGLSSRPEPGETLLGGISKKRLESFIKVLDAAGENAVSIDTMDFQNTSSGLLAFNGGQGHAGCLTTVVNPSATCRAADPANCPYHRTGKYAWGAESLNGSDVVDYLGEIGTANASDFSVSAPGEISTNLIFPRELISMLKADKSLAGWTIHTPRGDYAMGGGKTRRKAAAKPAATPAPSATPPAPAPAAAPKSSANAPAAASPGGSPYRFSASAVTPAVASAYQKLLGKLKPGPFADHIKAVLAKSASGRPSPTSQASTSTPDAPKPAAKTSRKEAPKAASPSGAAPAKAQNAAKTPRQPNPPLPTGSPVDFPEAGTGPGEFDFSKFSTWDSAGSGSTAPRKVKVNGKLYFVKKAGVNPQYTPEAAANEVNANTALRLAGLQAPDAKLYRDPTGTYCVTAGADLSGGTLVSHAKDPSIKEQMADAYPVMALLYNTDILQNPDNAFVDGRGRAVFLDNGSTFGYSAQGARASKAKFGFDYDKRDDPEAPDSAGGLTALCEFRSEGGQNWQNVLGDTPSDRKENILRRTAKYDMGALAKSMISKGLVPEEARAAFQKYADGMDKMAAKYRPQGATDDMEGVLAGPPPSLRLHRVLGDIAQLPADAIVNAANATLLGGGGVDGAIHRAAGPSLREACEAIAEISPGVRCPTGEVRVTEGYGLPAKWVLHTVGPVYAGGEAGEAEQLARCYSRALEAATALGCSTVAFPAISTGAYGYPLREADEVAERAVLAYLADHPELDVTFVTYAA